MCRQLVISLAFLCQSCWLEIRAVQYDPSSAHGKYLHTAHHIGDPLKALVMFDCRLLVSQQAVYPDLHASLQTIAVHVCIQVEMHSSAYAYGKQGMLCPTLASPSTTLRCRCLTLVQKTVWGSCSSLFELLTPTDVTCAAG